MVSVNLVGRMANQMFQIACVLGYALRHGLEYHIPAHTLNDSVWKPIFTHLENHNWNHKLPSIQINEESHAYNEILPAAKRMSMIVMEHGDVTDDILVDYNIIINGYRQSIKYFEDYLPEVRKAFGFDYTVSNEGTCAIHVRRGDYLNYPDKHPVVSESYLLKAINERCGYVEDFMFFSDDIEWCKFFVDKYSALLYQKQMPYIGYSEVKTEKEDFQKMLTCESFIISNSTYSLMAAILSESPNKIVISPDESNWFGPSNSHLDVSDLIPKEFIRIKY